MAPRPGQTVVTELPDPAVLGDAEGNATLTPQTAARGMLYNGATWDRERANGTSATGLASAARTATTYTATLTNHNSRGMLIKLDITVAGTGTLTVNVREPGFYYVGDGNFGTVTATASYLFYPGITKNITASSGNQGISAALPRDFIIGVQHSDASSWTYSLTYRLVN